MAVSFHYTPTKSGTELRLLEPSGVIPVSRWPIDAPSSLLPGVERLTELVASDQAVADESAVLVADDAIASLSAREATALGLPPMAEAMARVATRGIVNQPGFQATLQWCRPSGQAIVAPERIGAWLHIGGQDRRLSFALLAIAEAVEAVTNSSDMAARLLAVGRLREALPSAQEGGSATASGLPAQVDVIQADAFSLDLQGNGSAAKLVPILYRAGAEEPLLPPSQQDSFGHDQFNRYAEARPVYSLPGNTFVVLTPTLRRTLAEVRRHQSSPLAVKRDLMSNPRGFLRAALEADDDPTLLDRVESVFIETPTYSDRVIGLGLWEPREVPWLARTPTNWFGHDSSDVVPQRSVADLSPEEAGELCVSVDKAIAAGEPVVVYRPAGDAPDALPFKVPATAEMRDDLARRASGEAPPAPPPKSAQPAPLVPLIRTNEGKLEHQQDFLQRPAVPPGLPACLETPLKLHQTHGLEWLQRSWQAGAPGVLLADDMGLGKTLQGLAFLAWLREAMQSGLIKRRPVLIVAPTGLLANWSAEHARHLSGDGLGECVAAYGAGLRTLRQGPDKKLDVTRITSADWVLTTYETLRDNSGDFGTICFAAMLADEAQKVKTPGVRITDAIKAMNADFRIAMTGTPVENRLADLWCIVDGVRAGWLGDLNAFSRTYEAATDPEALQPLKAMLDQGFGGAPPLLLRRMKEDHLPDLPKASQNVSRAPMPDIQLRAYEATLAGARGDKTPGAVLAALQSFRALSLHPDPHMEADDAAFIAASARLTVCFAVLDSIAAAGERALIFVDKRDMQPRLAGLIQRRYRLAETPSIINGEVAGARRQARVDRFQAAPEGFDVMVLSPKAAGVGLTITRANHVIHLERWWNPAVEDQCTGRALRIGQTRTVHIHVPIATLPAGPKSFDENLHALLERKRTLMRNALLPPEFDTGDVDALFNTTVGDG